MQPFQRLFDEVRYLARYPDAARLIESGIVESGEQHWRTTEGPFQPFWWSPVRNRPVRVVILTPSLEMGGAERWVRTLALSLQTDKVQVVGVLLTGETANTELMAEITTRVPVHCHVSLPHATYSASRSDARDAAMRDADALLVWGLSEISTFVDRFDGRVVFCSHGTAPHAMKALDTVASYAPHLTAVSRIAAGDWIDDPRMNVIHNGVDLHRCRAKTPRAKVREAWGLDANKPCKVVGYIGRLSWEKDPMAVVRAVSVLPEHYRAVLIGNGPMHTEIAAHAATIAPNRCLLLGHVKEVGDALGALDALVLASHTEAHSLTLCEAWIAGVPTVCTPVGAVPELEDAYGKMTFSVPIDPTANELAAAVREAVNGRKSPEVDTARRVARRLFSTQYMVQQWEALFVELCSRMGHARVCVKPPEDDELIEEEPDPAGLPSLPVDPIFYEFGYAAAHPEVRPMLRRGMIKSAKDYWETTGRAKGHAPVWIRLDEIDFDEYLSRNPQLQTAIASGRAHSPQMHFYRFGNAELQRVERRKRTSQPPIA